MSHYVLDASLVDNKFNDKIKQNTMFYLVNFNHLKDKYNLSFIVNVDKL